MEGCYQYDKQLGYIPAIPEPFWFLSWVTLFRYRPSCYQCCRKRRIVLKVGKREWVLWNSVKPQIFKDRKEWESHYVLNHIEPLAHDEGPGPDWRGGITHSEHT